MEDILDSKDDENLINLFNVNLKREPKSRLQLILLSI